jgi:hypothetical protein
MTLLLSSATSLLLVFAASVACAQAGPTKVPALYKKIYAPGGYDSNEQVQRVGVGMVRNTCDRPAETTVQIDEANQKILVGPVAYEYAGLCLQVILPFQRVIEVGILKPGQWEVIQASSSERLGTVSVKAATRESPDDFLYAPVSQAFLRQRGMITEVLLAGSFPNSCFSLDTVKVTIEPEVLVLQPIAKVKKTQGCVDGSYPYSKVVSIPLVSKGRYLLHVRSMNGNAVNSLVDVQ